MKIEIATGAAADQLLSDERFVAKWHSLQADCPWATAFQGYDFARTWFSIYRHRFDPVLVFSRGQDETLQGLLVLAFPARPERGDVLIPVGGIQAEYHAWIATPASGDAFPLATIAALRHEFPSARLTFSYLAAGAPIAWATGPEGRRRCLLRPHRRPLAVFGDGRANAESLAKRGNKRRFKDLEKMGEVEFKRVVDPAEFEDLFDEMVRLYDFRHGAIQGTDPFCTIELQKEFHVAMMRVPGLLHATTMRVGGRVASALFGVVSGKEMEIGTIVHDASLAKQSPGKLQILLLCKMLIADGFTRLDLTPGGDAYKERFANAWDEVYTLTVLPTAYARAKASVAAGAKAILKRALDRRGVTSADAKHRVKAALWELKRPASLASKWGRRAGAWVLSRRETRVYSRAVSEFAGDAADPKGGCPDSDRRSRPPIRRDALDDLLAYRPARSGASRQVFLSAALSRVEQGQSFYTVAGDGSLEFCAWVDEQPSEEVVAALLPGLVLPSGSALVYGLQEFASQGSGSRAATCLQTILADATRAAAVRRVFLIVPPGDTETGRLAENLGFTLDGSVISKVRFGRSRSWAEGALAKPRDVAAVSSPSPRATPSTTEPGASPRPSGSAEISRNRAKRPEPTNA